MTISIVDDTAPVTAGATSFVIDKPTGTDEGDLMLMFVNFTNFVSPIYPEGWFEVPKTMVSESQYGFAILFKYAGPSEPSTYTLTFASSTISAMGIVTVRGAVAGALYVPDAATLFVDVTDDTAPQSTVWPTVDAGDAGLLLAFGAFPFARTADALTELWDGSGAGIQRPYLMYGTFAGPTTPAATATSPNFTRDYRSTSVPVIEGVPPAIPGVHYITRAFNSSGSADGSLSLTIPTDVEEGDFLVAHFSAQVDKNPVTPDGWTLRDDATIDSTWGLYVYTKTASDGDAGSTLSVTFDGGSTAAAFGLTAYRSLRGRTIAIEMVAKQTNSSSTTMTFPTATTAYDHAMLVFLSSETLTSAFGANLGNPVRYHATNIRAYNQAVFAPDDYDFAPTVGSASAQRVAVMVLVEVDPQINGYMVGDGADVPIDELTRLDPQPRNEGIRITRRQSSHSGDAHDDEALYTIFEYTALGSVAEYQAVLDTWGLLNALTNEVTATARDQNQVWQRWSGTVTRPRVNEDIRWESYFIRNVQIVMTNISLVE